MGVMDVIEEVRPSLVPDGSVDDDSLARPVEYAPDTLYAWPLTEAFDPDGDGSLDLDRFTFRMAWGVPADGEVAALERDRDTSLAIKAFLDATVAWIASHRTGSAYENLQITAVDHQALITHSIRGVLVDVTGYELLA